MKVLLLVLFLLINSTTYLVEKNILGSKSNTSVGDELNSSFITNFQIAKDFDDINFYRLFNIQFSNNNDEIGKSPEVQYINDENQHGYKNKYIYYIIIILLAFSIIIIFLIYNKKKELKKQNEIIKLQNSLLEDLNSTKDKFFSIIAHDLKNPISSFHQLSEALSENYDMFTKEDKEEFFDELKSSSKGLYDLLETLLAWSNSQRGKIPFSKEENDIKFIIDSTLAPLSIHSLNKKIKLINDIPENIIVNFDSNMISTVIRNLVSNALKFSNENTNIRISHKIDNEKIIISIADQGVGMSKEIMDKLFRIDESVSSIGTSGEKGTGLGLILCKEFIENHNGKIWVESTIGEGSTFKFEIPIN